jgi:hypothetical protein
MLIALGAAPAACGPTPADVTAWENEDGGPEKLADVVSNEKATYAMRRDAALALTRLTRRGRKVGLDLLVTALAAIKDARSRDEIVKWMSEDIAPRIENDHAAKGDHTATDAAYALLGNQLAGDGAVKARLEDALLKWVGENTADKLDDRSGRYSAEQIIRMLSPKSRVLLVPMLASQRTRRRAADMITELGDRDTFAEATKSIAAQIVALRTNAARDQLRREVEDANAKSNVKPTSQQVDLQVERYRKNQVLELLANDRLAGDSAFLIAIASDATEDSTIRARALDVARRDLAFYTDESDEAVVALAENEGTAEEVLEQCFEVVRASKRSDALVDELSKSKSWKARFVARAVALAHVKDASGLDGFMARLPQKPDVPIFLEALRYEADEIVRRFGREPLRPFLTSAALGPKLVALIAFRGDEAAIAPAKNDTTALPTCETCGWSELGLATQTVGALATTSLMTRDGLDTRPSVDLSGLSGEPSRDRSSQLNTLQKELLKALDDGQKHSPGGVKR